MLRNFGVTGLVASVMGVFVLALRALSPTPELPPRMLSGETPNASGIATSAQTQPQAGTGYAMVPQQPQTGQSTGGTNLQPGPMPQAQTTSMQTQQMPKMGMCGGMMKMMMGGQMNQGGQTNQPGGTMQQPPPPQTQPQGTGTTQTTAQVVRR